MVVKKKHLMKELYQTDFNLSLINQSKYLVFSQVCWTEVSLNSHFSILKILVVIIINIIIIDIIKYHFNFHNTFVASAFLFDVFPKWSMAKEWQTQEFNPNFLTLKLLLSFNI